LVKIYLYFAKTVIKLQVLDKRRANTNQGAAPLEIPSRAILDGIRNHHAALGDLEVRSQESEEKFKNKGIMKSAPQLQTGNREL
jgi:hypothetical protein